ncbi:MAG TPA: cell wall metabolism sensor histidine kinase WalK [Caldilineae bacterium]|nr:cell wall metabolism sensor histidine kinase WalK [Caldilineae bacterium]
MTLLRRRLGWKLFLAHLVIVLIGVTVLATTAEYHAPSALAKHIAQMRAILGDDPALVADLHDNFLAAVHEVLLFAAGAAIVAAVIVSTFTARRIVAPVRAMMEASQRIAAGDYRERVRVTSEDELGTLAQAFNRMAETLERTEQRRLELIGNVAHELRTPLSSIKSIMEGLIDGVLPPEPATFLDVQREVARLQRLVQDLEELSRAEAGQIALHRQYVSLADLIRSAAARLEPQFEDKSVNLHLVLPEDLPKVWVDPSRVTQVLLNLMGNALQYTSPGGTVWVRARVQEDEAVVEVQDTGIGISPEHLPHIFERFYRVDKSRSRAGGGSGIGLTIAKHLVKAHDGRIWAESLGPGQGSTFTFTIPLSSSSNPA